uniref:Uncharacterized protein n=1 Tax=Cacopsylla melanoneura TaxID=428564 RepID=A0A8D9E987_9HEMI
MMLLLLLAPSPSFEFERGFRYEYFGGFHLIHLLVCLFLKYSLGSYCEPDLFFGRISQISLSLLSSSDLLVCVFIVLLGILVVIELRTSQKFGTPRITVKPLYGILDNKERK